MYAFKTYEVVVQVESTTGEWTDKKTVRASSDESAILQAVQWATSLGERLISVFIHSKEGKVYPY